MRARRRAVLTTTLATAAALVATAGTTAVAADRPDDRPGQGEVRSTQGFRKHVTLEGVMEHQRVFQRIADANGGTRAAGSPGYVASADYVARKARQAGLEVSTQSFEFVYNADRTPAVLTRTAPTPVSYTDGVEFASATYSGNGDVTADVVAVDLVLPPPEGPGNANTSGCEPADFTGFTAGAVALVQRGTCTFAVKAANAEAAGAVAVVIFNEGQVGRDGLLSPTLGEPGLVSIPVVGTSFAVGDALAAGTTGGRTGTTVRVRVDRVEETRTTTNVFAQTRGGDPDRVVVVGAHLDSVPRGPGINDNGSGSAGILEIAETLAKREDPRNTVRFAWWGAEEFGLLGSQAYVESLSQAEKDRIVLNLNFDMIGSPNFVRFVYDGDNSAFPVGPGAADGPAGSGRIEQVFHDYFRAVGLASSETPFSGRSDYGPFIAEGIPAGGLFTGAEGLKTEAEAAVYGGTAGLAYDPCYHLACDTIANLDRRGLDQMTDAAAHATLTFARQDFDRRPLVDPSVPVTGTTAGGEGGGLHADHDHEAELR